MNMGNGMTGDRERKKADFVEVLFSDSLKILNQPPSERLEERAFHVRFSN